MKILTCNVSGFLEAEGVGNSVYIYIYRQEALDTFKKKGTFTWKQQCEQGEKCVHEC